MKKKYVIIPVLFAVVATGISGANANPPVETNVQVRSIEATYVEQDTQKEQAILAEAAERIEAEREAERRAIKLEQERKEAERIAKEAEQARIVAENARLEAERIAQEEAEKARILAEQQAEQARIAEEERIAKEAEQIAVVPAPVVPAQSGEAWIHETMAAYGVFAPAGTTFLVTDVENCGGPGGACTTGLADSETKMFVRPVTIRISPSAIGKTHTLFHEIAHSHNIIDECEAERWAQNVTKDYSTFAYPHCF